MTAIDIATLRKHIGTRIVDEDVATEAPLRAIVATFDRKEAAPREGEADPARLAHRLFPVDVAAPRRWPRRPADGRRRAAENPAAAAHVCRHPPHLPRADPGRRRAAPRDRAQRPAGARGRHRHPASSPRRRGASSRRAASPSPRMRHGVPRGGEAGRQERHPQARRGAGGPALAADHHARSGHALPLLGADLQPAPHPLRPPLRHGGRGLSRPRRARAVHAAVPDRTSCATTIPAAPIRTFSMRARAPLFDTAPFDLVGRPTEGGAAARCGP